MSDAQDIREHKLTAYALGELDKTERAEVEAWMAEDPAARETVEEIRATIAMIEQDIAAEPGVSLTKSQTARIAAGPKTAERSGRGWMVGIAAIAAVGLGFALWPSGGDTVGGEREEIAGVSANEGAEDPAKPLVEAGSPLLSLADADGEPLPTEEIQPPLAAAPAPPASPRLAEVASANALTNSVASYFDVNRKQRLYVQLDKPLYRPGETVWLKSWDLAARDFSGRSGATSALYELVDPKGAVVVKKRVEAKAGRASNDLLIPPGAAGGQYVVRVTTASAQVVEKPLVVSAYEPPRIKKKLELLRKAYGPGDEVRATLTLKRPTGEPVANREVTAVVKLDGQELPRVAMTTNKDGAGIVKFSLPEAIAVGDSMLTVLVTDGGVTESVSKRVPILMKKMQLAFFPEGGDLVEGLESRVYFSAKNMLNKPADVAGQIVDDHGAVVAKFESYKNGMGRFPMLPATGRRYFAEVTQPVGITERYALPLSKDAGCVVQSFDDVDGQAAALRVGVRCTDERSVVVAATLRERLLDSAAVAAGPREPAIAYLKSSDDLLTRAQGVARVTVFDTELRPLAERIVYRNRRDRLGITVTPDKDDYTPRDRVTLTIETTNAEGRPVPANLAMSVVDDTVISYADDKQGHMLSRLLLEPELPGDVEEPNFYLDLTEAKSGVALDLLMGTRGYRRFDWRPVTQPAVASATATATTTTQAGSGPVIVADASPPADRAKLVKAKEARRAAELDPNVAVPMGQPVVLAHNAVGNNDDVPVPDAAGKEAEKPMIVAALGDAEAPMNEPLEADMVAGGEDDDFADEDEDAVRGELRADRNVARGPVGADGVFALGAKGFGGLAAGPAEPEPEVIDALDAKMGGLKDRVFRGKGRLGLLKQEILDARVQEQQLLPLSPVRVFPTPTYEPGFVGTRSDFRDTIFWAPEVVTDANGKATVTFSASDAVTSFRIFTEGTGDGRLGRDETVMSSRLPFSMTVKLPAAVTSRDVVSLPLTLTNERDVAATVTVDADLGEFLALTDASKARQNVTLEPKSRKTLFYAAKPSGKDGQSKVVFKVQAEGLRDAFTREITVAGAGFPRERSHSGQLAGKTSHDIDLGGALPGSVEATVTLYPSPVATLTSGLKGILRQPTGCFEQASSANYPNVMVMNYLQTHEIDDVDLLARSKTLLEAGYRKLTSYETKSKGYEWFGQSPGHEALSAYGLVQFVDMEAVFGAVDGEMVARTRKWLRSRRDGKGGYKVNPRALDSFGRASADVTNAYITYSLTEAGEKDLPDELANVARLAETSDDAYIVALAANAMLNVAAYKAKGEAAVTRLLELQDKTGGWLKASHSITRSGGSNLHIETTSLALMALLKAESGAEAVDRGVRWLNENRSGGGGFGTTQATILSLKALTRYADARRQTQKPGTLTVLVDGKKVGELAYDAGHEGALELPGLGQFLTKASQRVELIHDGQSMPYSLSVRHRTLKPPADMSSTVTLKTTIAEDTVKMGETVRVTATVSNATDDGQPMALARVGLPGGLTFQTWQLKELADKGVIAFYETRPREIILYFRDLAPNAKIEVPLDLVAVVPGTYEGPASSGYLYYTDDVKHWVDGIQVAVVQ